MDSINAKSFDAQLRDIYTFLYGRFSRAGGHRKSTHAVVTGFKNNTRSAGAGKATRDEKCLLAGAQLNCSHACHNMQIHYAGSGQSIAIFGQKIKMRINAGEQIVLLGFRSVY